MELSLQEISELLNKTGKILNKNPCYTPAIKNTVDILEPLENSEYPISYVAEEIIDLIRDKIWSNISSSQSEIIPLEGQKRIMEKLGSDLISISEVIRYSPQPISDFTHLMYDLHKEWEKYLEEIPKKTILPRLDDEKIEKIKEDLPFEKGLIDLLKVLVRRNEENSFLLLSGHRTSYFFNLSYSSSNEKFRKKYKYFVNKGISKILESSRLKEEPNGILFVKKIRGEADQIPVVSAIQCLEKYPHYEYVSYGKSPAINPIKGMTDPTNAKLLVIDNLSTSGTTIRKVVTQLEKNQFNAVGYVIILDRSEKGQKEKESDVPIFSLLSRNQLLENKVFSPEILEYDVDSELWTSLDLTVDSLKEICIYSSIKSHYDSFADGFNLIISNAYNYQPKGLFDYLERSDEEKLRTILINVIILIYNSIQKHSENLMKIDRHLNTKSYLENILEEEKKSGIVSREVVNILSKGFSKKKTYERKDNDNKITVDRTMDYFAINYEVIGNVKDKYLESKGIVKSRIDYKLAVPLQEAEEYDSMLTDDPQGNYEEIIDEYTKKLAKTKEHYIKGQEFNLDLDRISELTGIDFKYKPKKGLIDGPKFDVIVKTLYRNKEK